MRTDDEFFDPDDEDELPPVVQKDEQGVDDDGDLRPSKIWVNPVPHITEAMDQALECLSNGVFDSLKIIALADAMSIAIPERDVYDFSQWKRLDMDFGPLLTGTGSELTPEHYLARLKVLRQIGKSLGMMGQVAPQGEPAKFLSFESLCPRVREE